jgi:uroporphyrinogen decarboxylase
MTSRERVKAAFAQSEGDFPPSDYFSTPEIQEALLGHFKVDRDDDLRDCLGTDIRYINPPYIGPELPTYDDGGVMNIWGIIKKPMPNEYGDYAEPVNFPYAGWTTVEEAEAFDWPSPDWYDYSAIPAMCERYPDLAIAAGNTSVQDFINGVAFGRGVEQVLLDIALEDPVYLYIVEQRHRFWMEHIERVLEAAKGRVDFVFCGDDFGTQRDLLISPDTFDRLFAPKKKELFDLAHSYGAYVSHHCCGSTVKLFPNYIRIGMDALQTIQPQAVGMSPYELKKKFRGQITLHGGVDVQGWLQRSTPQEIEAEVFKLLAEVGEGGGYILSPCHNIQPDTPTENVLTLYRAVLKYRGQSPDY